MDKKQLRKLARQKRQELSSQYRKQASKIICEKLRPYLENKTILSYYPFNEEVDVSYINGRYQVAYPVLLQNKEIAAYLPQNGHFLLNSFGIQEPDLKTAIPLAEKEIDVIIVPLLAFNEDLHRLGYGGGCYDRYLRDHEGLKIGVAYEIQKTDQLVPDLYDVALDLIISEEKIYANRISAF